MHSKYAGEGLVVLSVHVYNPGEGEADRKKGQEKALEFLQKVKADFPNLLLDEPYEVWEKRLGESNVPLAFVFNRQNQREAKYTDAQEAVAGLDKLIPALLKQ